MGATKKGAHTCTPNLSNYRATGESVSTNQRYKNNRFDEQSMKFQSEFSKGVYTMKQVSVKTNIDRANLCRWIAKKRKSNSVYLVRRGICPITKCGGVGFYTTNYDLYLTHKML
jgi:hypothetical protein